MDAPTGLRSPFDARRAPRPASRAGGSPEARPEASTGGRGERDAGLPRPLRRGLAQGLAPDARGATTQDRGEGRALPPGLAAPRVGPGARAGHTYAATRDRLATYFDRTAAAAWERLTSDAPVSRIRRTVREGREAMRAALLARLPLDMTGMRVLDAGCGPGDLAVAMARRGAEVVGVDLSASLLDVARRRLPPDVAARVHLFQGDMLADRGRFDATLAMDSLIHYRLEDVAAALAALAPRSGLTLFTVAPRTPLLMAMHTAGRLLPASDRAPRIVPHGERALARATAGHGLPAPRAIARVHRGFYVSGAWEMRP